MPLEPDVRRYAQELQDMLRERSPAAYRAFLARWRDLHQRGVADQLALMDDAALRLRLERMILDMPGLADLHDSARAYLAEHGATTPAVAPSGPSGPGITRRAAPAPPAEPNAPAEPPAAAPPRTRPRPRVRLRRRPN